MFPNCYSVCRALESSALYVSYNARMVQPPYFRETHQRGSSDVLLLVGHALGECFYGLRKFRNSSSSPRTYTPSALYCMFRLMLEWYDHNVSKEGRDQLGSSDQLLLSKDSAMVYWIVTLH